MLNTARTRPRGALRARLYYLWFELDPAGVELLSAALSATFVVLLLYRRTGTTPLDHAHAYAGMCGLASAAKVVGVVLEVRALRLVGLALGAVFWATLSYVLLRGNSNSIAWLCFAVLALAQGWGWWRVVRP
jgi:NADH:ubiquinone oxidoreductase subunit 2 (subunit N)